MLATKINKNQWLSFVFALMKCSKAAFGEQHKKCLLGVRKSSMPSEGVKRFNV